MQECPWSSDSQSLVSPDMQPDEGSGEPSPALCITLILPTLLPSLSFTQMIIHPRSSHTKSNNNSCAPRSLALNFHSTELRFLLSSSYCRFIFDLPGLNRKARNPSLSKITSTSQREEKYIWSASESEPTKFSDQNTAVNQTEPFSEFRGCHFCSKQFAQIYEVERGNAEGKAYKRCSLQKPDPFKSFQRVNKILAKGEAVDIICLDFQKALDKACQKKLSKVFCLIFISLASPGPNFSAALLEEIF